MLSGVTATLVKDINTIDSYPSELTPAGSNLFYTVEGSAAGGVALAVTTSAGTTHILQDFTPGQASSAMSYPSDPPTGPEDLTAVGNDVYFLASNGTASDVLWFSNGKSVQQVSFSDPNAPAATVVANLAAVGDSFYFTSEDPTDAAGRRDLPDGSLDHRARKQPAHPG